MMMQQGEIWTDNSTQLLVFEITSKSLQWTIHPQWKRNNFMLKQNTSKKKILQHNSYKIALNIQILWHTFKLLNI